MVTNATKREGLLDNIECEYKYALNAHFADEFAAAFCDKFNELVRARLLHGDDCCQCALNCYHDQSDCPDCSRECKCRDPQFKTVSLDDFKVEKLSNCYFDTEENDLFHSFKAGLRLRRSSLQSGVEQTIKFQTKVEGAFHTHFEFNTHTEQDLSLPDAQLFVSDPSIAASLPTELVALLFNSKLRPLYKTDFIRKSCVFVMPHFLTFEMAIDQGEIVADATGRKAPISEVEFELKSLDKGYLDLCWGKSIFDLDEIRLEFGSFLNSILLQINNPHGKYSHNDMPVLDCSWCEDHDSSFDHNSMDVSGVARALPQVPKPDSDHLGGEEGLLGLEPFSKLRRAVILSQCPADGPLPRAKISQLSESLDKYDALDAPDLPTFTKMVEKIVDCYNEALGLANLFGTEQHFKDLKDFLFLVNGYAHSHRRIRASETNRAFHRQICQDPELLDLSMLSVLECTCLFIEFNTRLWFLPLFKDLSSALYAIERQHAEGIVAEPLNSAAFAKICRTAVGHTFSLKSSEFLDRLFYILKRQNTLLTSDTTGQKPLTLATQYQMRKAWSRIKFCI